MTDAGEIFVIHLQEAWLQARHHEDQRAMMANILVGVAAALHAVLANIGFSIDALPVTIFIFILGVYGFIGSAKQYERNRYHVNRAREIRKRLHELFPEANVSHVIDLAFTSHPERFVLENTPGSTMGSIPEATKTTRIKHVFRTRLIQLRLNTLWHTLHGIIAVLGLIYTIISIF